jgi:hypothetical protein
VVCAAEDFVAATPGDDLEHPSPNISKSAAKHTAVFDPLADILMSCNNNIVDSLADSHRARGSGH